MKYHDKRFKHTRIPLNPDEKTKYPSTFGHTYGFGFESPEKPEYTKTQRFPKVNCPETKYVEEMIKTNQHL